MTVGEKMKEKTGPPLHQVRGSLSEYQVQVSNKRYICCRGERPAEKEVTRPSKCVKCPTKTHAVKKFKTLGRPPAYVAMF